MTNPNQNDQDKLETAIDNFGLSTVLDMMTDICNEKADHIYESYQDASLSSAWEKAAKKIDNTAYTIRQVQRL